MTKLRIVALCGPKYSGKDTAAKGLFAINTGESKNLFRRTPMAEGVKNIVHDMFGIPHEVMEDPVLKELIYTPANIIPRWPMMDIANWLRDKYGGDIHARRWERIALASESWGAHVITDLRFPEEVEMVRRHEGLILYVQRPAAEEALAQSQQSGDAMALNQSESHYEMLQREADAVLLNDTTISNLHGQVQTAVKLKFEHWKFWGDI